MSPNSEESDNQVQLYWQTRLCLDKGVQTDVVRSKSSFPAELAHLLASRIKEFSSTLRNRRNHVTCKITLSQEGRVHKVILEPQLPGIRQMRALSSPDVRCHFCKISNPHAHGSSERPHTVTGTELSARLQNKNFTSEVRTDMRNFSPTSDFSLKAVMST